MKQARETDKIQNIASTEAVISDYEYFGSYGGKGFPGAKGELIVMSFFCSLLIMVYLLGAIICGGIWEMCEHNVILLVPELVFFVFLVVCPVKSFMEYRRAFRFAADGIYIKYPVLKEQLICWDKVPDVYLKNPNGCTPVNRKYCTAICFVHKSKEIRVAYSQKAMDQLLSVCPLEIADYR